MPDYSSTASAAPAAQASRFAARGVSLRHFHPLHRRLESHFVFDVAGTRIAYCYIRKNACSAFKRLMLDLAGYEGPRTGTIGFLIDRYAARGLAHVLSADWRIFVYRDPFDRAASLFRSKMIMQKGAAPFLESYRSVTGSDPDTASFSQFVTGYLCGSSLDPHARSQASHLLPVRYNMVSTLSGLQDAMRRICGADIADAYFSKRTNSSSALLFDESSTELPASILRARYLDSGELPSTGALRNAALETAIRRIYRRDYALDPSGRPVNIVGPGRASTTSP